MPETPDIPSAVTPLSNLTRPKPKTVYVPDKSQKRNLSAGSTPSPSLITQIDKKLRGDTEFDWLVDNMEPEVTLADLMDQLKLTAKSTDLIDLATKKDVQEIRGIVSSHTLELQQLREDLESQAKRIQQLEESFGGQAAASLSRTQPDVDTFRSRQYGGPRAGSSQPNPRRRNLVFEGLPLLSDRDTIGFVIQLCSSLGIIAYYTDFEGVQPMRRRDGSSRPPPVLITFTEYHVRSAILRNKVKLADTEKYASVFINLDEPVELRRAKAVLRQVGYQARLDGKTVQLKDDWIKIDDEEFKISDLDRIPEKYRANLQPKTRPTDASAPTSLQKPNTPNPPTRTKRIKIKMTKAGLTFSGPSAYLSHMHRCPVVYKKVSYSSVEQGYHHLHAVFEGEEELAKAIMNVHDPYAIKDAAEPLPKSEAWGKVAPGRMWELNEAKYDQNPDLKKQLLETAPALLIEASVDSKWGGACPFGSDIYDQGIVPGTNLCGTQLTQYRNNILADMDKLRMS